MVWYYDCIKPSEDRSPTVVHRTVQHCGDGGPFPDKTPRKQKPNPFVCFTSPAGWSEGKATKPKASHRDAALRRADLTCCCPGGGHLPVGSGRRAPCSGDGHAPAPTAGTAPPPPGSPARRAQAGRRTLCKTFVCPLSRSAAK